MATVSICRHPRGLEVSGIAPAVAFYVAIREREDAGIIVLPRRSVEEEPGGAM